MNSKHKKNNVIRSGSLPDRNYLSLLEEVEACLASFKNEKSFYVNKLIKKYEIDFPTFCDIVSANQRVKYAAYSVYRNEFLLKLTDELVLAPESWILNEKSMSEILRGRGKHFLNQKQETIYSSNPVLSKNKEILSLELIWFRYKGNLKFLVVPCLK